MRCSIVLLVTSEKMDEFGFIEKYLAPLATDDGAFALTDDAAVFSCEEGKEIVIAKDAISEGVHFLPNTEPRLIAKKLVRVNLSDMAAMGANPKHYLMSAALNSKVDELWLKEFCESLAEEQKEFGISLLGGDTIKQSGPITLSMTMIGEVEKEKILRRNGAKIGDDIYVTGNLGNAAFGLKILQNTLKIEQNDAKSEFVGKYCLPNPQIGAGTALVGLISAAIDVSDGLLGDLSRICDCSGVGAEIYKNILPVSENATQLLERQENLWSLVLSGGDDYELLFTAAPAKAAEIEAISQKIDVKMTKIGQIKEKTGVNVLDSAGNIITFDNTGYKHL
jgi:thiamine-monophosphate kinase